MNAFFKNLKCATTGHDQLISENSLRFLQLDRIVNLRKILDEWRLIYVVDKTSTWTYPNHLHFFVFVLYSSNILYTCAMCIAYILATVGWGPGEGTQPPSPLSPPGPGSERLCNAMEKELPHSPSLPHPAS